jgi:hypothetical protein
LGVEVTARVIVYHVEDDGDAVQMAEVDKAF